MIKVSEISVTQRRTANEQRVAVSAKLVEGNDSTSAKQEKLRAKNEPPEEILKGKGMVWWIRNGKTSLARGVQGDGILRDKEEGKESGVDPLCIT